MSNDNSGGSTTVVNDGFGFGGTATIQPASEPLKAEDSAPEKGGEQVLDKDAKTELQPKEEAPKEEKVIEKPADTAHRAVIDMLEDKLKQVNTGKMDEKELKEWFKTHPELADTANRSKRIKGTMELNWKPANSFLGVTPKRTL